MKQTERITAMEQRLDQATQAVKELSAALDAYAAALPAIGELAEYYGSSTWKQDLADDAAGRLPQELKRGVLSEDGIWNLLEDCRNVKARLHDMSAE